MSDNDNDDNTDMRTTQVKRTPTSLNLDEELWDRVKIRAITKKTTATELVEEALRKYLETE